MDIGSFGCGVAAILFVEFVALVLLIALYMGGDKK